jgi:hypothetical protein
MVILGNTTYFRKTQNGNSTFRLYFRHPEQWIKLDTFITVP